jgi:hypothetical protein
MMGKHAEWEWLGKDTDRLRVPGGWIYRSKIIGLGTASSLFMVFVPELGLKADLEVRGS